MRRNPKGHNVSPTATLYTLKQTTTKHANMKTMPTIIARILFSFLVLTATSIRFVSGQEVSANSDEYKIVQDDKGCTTKIHEYDPLIHKPKYTIGVFSSDSKVYTDFNLTFVEYLTSTAGQKFDPPVQFVMLAVTQDSMEELIQKQEVDFFYGLSTIYSCMSTMFGAMPLVTGVVRRYCRGYEYDLDQQGGVMFTLKDSDIETVEDFKDRTIGFGGITMMGGGQAQIYELFRRGMSFVNDPKQVIVTGDETATVQGVLDGDFDIGFTRTDKIERHRDANGELIDPDVFKIINPRTHVLEDGRLFPFMSSTDLYPEWPVASFRHVSHLVSLEVMNALLALQDHAEFAVNNETQRLRCDTTSELARLALDAKAAALFTGFRTASSYADVRSKQEAMGFLRPAGEEKWICASDKTMYDDLKCPSGHYKTKGDDFYNSCEVKGMDCKGQLCFCKPCVKAFDVDVYQVMAGGDDEALAISSAVQNQGCEKMSICGHIEQTKEIVLRIVDNMKRENTRVEARIHSDRTAEHIEVKSIPNEPHNYEIRWSSDTIEVGILEISFDDVQIPESPIRLQVEKRDCAVDYPGHGKVASENGSCECGGSTIDVGGKCVESIVFAIVGSIGGFFLVIMTAYFYLRYKNRKNDEMWQVNTEDLHFDDPVRVIGQGSFGVVLLAEYRGTKVAIKRAIKSKVKDGSVSKKSLRKGSKASETNGHGSESIDITRDTRRDSAAMSALSDEGDIESPPDAESPAISKLCGSMSNSRSRSSWIGGSRKSSDVMSLSFLAEDLGKRGRLASLFPWMTKKRSKDHHFTESILGSTNSLSMMRNRSITSRICPWFNEQARLEEEFIDEMRVLSRLRHPCITTVMGAVVTHTHDPMLVMEYMEYGSLHDLLRNETMVLTGEIIMQVIRDVVQGLRYLHTSRPPILHGDMKSRNILIDSRFRAKLCDFGLSTKKTNHVTGTPFWLAPEYLRGDHEYDAACDMYALGIILYEIYSRKSPYEGEDFRETLRKICNRRINKRPTIPETTPPKFVDLMKKCWSPDASFRPQAKDLDMTLMQMIVIDAEPLEEGQTMEKRKRSGDMLYELFPKHVADALAAGQKVEPESHEMVTVIFSDIVSFTDISREISPMKVSYMLDRLYQAFDKIARRHSVFKVETIGDAYMGVTNLESNQSNVHVKNIAEFAIDMISEARMIQIDEEDPGRGFVNIRVGFHSGPVVSNVIGSLNKRYGLFGDTVNTASRMESNSTVNRILCSEASYLLLKEQAPDMKIRKRGKINVKGKGEMNVYWVADNQITPKDIEVNIGKGRHVGFVAEDDDKQVNKCIYPPEVFAGPVDSAIDGLKSN